MSVVIPFPGRRDRPATWPLPAVRPLEVQVDIDPRPISSAARLRELAGMVLETVPEPPPANCTCHVAPPCLDCTDHWALRELFAAARAAIASTEGVLR